MWWTGRRANRELERFTSGIEMLQKWGLKFSETDEREDAVQSTMKWC